MVDYNRRLKRESWDNTVLQCIGNVHGNIEISKGDLVFLDRVNGLRERGISIADNYIYPFNKISGTTLTLASNKNLASENFLGVSSWHSDSGVTEKLSVEIVGLFSYPLKLSKTLKIGYDIIPVGSGTTLYNQKVGVESDSSYAIGKVAISGKFKSSVEMFIQSKVLNVGTYFTT